MTLLLSAPGGTELIILFFVLMLILLPLRIIALWRVYEKANQPGWAAIIPFYNIIVLNEIIKKPWWWLLLLFIPIVNIVILIWTYNLLSKRFGQTEVFTLGLVLLPSIFLSILAFGDAKYNNL